MEWLTILWWFMAWVFVGFLLALVLGPVLRENSRRYPPIQRGRGR